MESEVLTVPETALYRDVADAMYARQQRTALVVNGGGHVIGMISEHDLFRILYPFYGSYYLHAEQYTDLEDRERKILEVQTHPVQRFMQKTVYTAAPDDPVMRVGAIMLARNVRRIPVMEEGKPIGMVTRPAIFRAIYETHLRDAGR